MPKHRYKSDAEVEEVVRRFECCEFAIDEFDHVFHLTVAVVYLSRYGEAVAMERMRESLLRFSRHHGRMGYHETITRWWLRMVAAEPAASEPLYGRANHVVSKFADKDLVFQYYTRERLMSDEAKKEWVEPDLKKVPSTGYRVEGPTTADDSSGTGY
jgi:hypothetical protein